MTLLAVAVNGRGVVDPEEPVLRADDDALLAEMSNVLDSLYAHFQRQGQGASDKGSTR